MGQFISNKIGLLPESDRQVIAQQCQLRSLLLAQLFLGWRVYRSLSLAASATLSISAIASQIGSF